MLGVLVDDRCNRIVANNIDAANLRTTYKGFKSRGNVTWHVTPDTMIYFTYSQGFRPGGFNQNGGSAHAPGPNGVPQYLLASAYVSEKSWLG